MLSRFLASIAGMMELLSTNLGKTVKGGFLGVVVRRENCHELTCGRGKF